MVAAGDLKARLKALKSQTTCKLVFCSSCHPALKGHGRGVFCNLQILPHSLGSGYVLRSFLGGSARFPDTPSRSRRLYSEALSDFSIFLCPECYAQALKDPELKVLLTRREKPQGVWGDAISLECACLPVTAHFLRR